MWTSTSLVPALRRLHAAPMKRATAAPRGALLPRVASAFADALLETATAGGAPRGALEAALGGAERSPDEAARGVALPGYLEAWELAVRATGDDALPLAVARRASVPLHGTLGFVLYTSATLRAAIDDLVGHQALVDDSGRFSFEPLGGGGVVRWHGDLPATPGRELANEHALAWLLHLVRSIVASPIDVEEAWLERAEPAESAAAELYRACFGSRKHWASGRVAIRLGAEALDLRPRGADPMLHAFFARRAEAELRARQDAWTARTAGVVAERLAEGIPSLAAIAAGLGVAERTLRRRLRDEGTPYVEIVRAVQLARARDLLSAGVPVGDVALATGFADPTTFSRAFRRWTGQPPSSSRRSS